MVKSGPGTIWETWGGDTNSHNHPALTGGVGLFLRQLAGAPVLENGPSVLVFSPMACTALRIRSASASSWSPWGEASWSWQLTQESFIANVTVPYGASGRVHLHMPVSLTEACLWQRVNEPEVVAKGNKSVVVSVSAGNTQLQLAACPQKFGSRQSTVFNV